MRIDLPGIEAFLGVANLGSFRRAAAHMNLSQAALSHRVKKLEEALGTALLARTTRRVTLTEAGLELLPVAQRAVGDIEGALVGLRDRGSGGPERLAVGCLPTIALLHLPAALAEFGRLRPAVRVQVYDNSADEIVRRVRAGEADFGITVTSVRGLDLDITPLTHDPFRAGLSDGSRPGHSGERAMAGVGGRGADPHQRGSDQPHPDRRGAQPEAGNDALAVRGAARADGDGHGSGRAGADGAAALRTGRA